MANSAVLKIEIIAEAAKAAAGLRSVGKSVGDAPDKLAKTSSGLSKLKGVAIVAGAAIGGALVGMFKTGLDEQKDFLAGQAQLKNGLKTTGNQAHTTVGHLEDLASSIQDYSGQSDDSIVNSEKLLLTFTKIGNHAGKNNKIFDDATQITADMAAKMGGDASKYAVQLGKALNDPVKGISALSRVGVSFSDSQKKMINRMVATGDTMGAQKVIIKELNKEFGGSAKAYGDTLPGQMDKAKRSFEDISQNLVASFMPIISDLANILTKTLLPVLSSVMGFLTSHKGVLIAFAGGIAGIYAAIKIGQATSAIGNAGGLLAYVKGTNLAAGATKIWAGIQLAFNAIMDANPIVLIVGGLILLGAAIVIAYKKSATFRKIVQSAFRAVASVAKAMWSIIKTVFKAIWDVLVFVGKAWFTVYVKPYILAYQLLKTAITAAVSWIKSTFTGLVSAIGRIFHAVIEAITSPFRKAWDWIRNTLLPGLKSGWDAVVRAVRSALSGILGAITAPFRAAWDWIRNTFLPAIKGAWDSVSGAVARGLASVAAAITAPFERAWTWVRDHVIAPLKSAWSDIVSGVARALSGVFDAIISPFQKAWNWVSSNVIAPLKRAWDDVFGVFKSAWNGFANFWNGLQITLPSWKMPFPPHKTIGGGTLGLPDLPTLAAGAYVTNATTAVIGEAGPEIVAPDAMLRRIIRDEIGNAPTVIVNGALDPDAVARQIDSILTRRARRVSGVRRVGASPA